MGLLCVKDDGIHSVKTSISRRTCMCVNQSQAYVMLVAVSFLSNLHYPFSTEFNFVTDSQVINQFIFRHLVIPPVLLGQAGGQRVPAVLEGSGGYVWRVILRCTQEIVQFFRQKLARYFRYNLI